MKKSFKKVLSALLVAVMLICTIPLSASAAYENTYANTGNQRNDIIGVAKTQLGYTEGSNNATKYGTWYGLPNQPWCAMFISWCARQADIPTSVLKNSAVASPNSQYFNIPYYDGTSYTPQKGDLFFTKSWSHVGLVYYVDGDYFYTIEGNSNTTGSSEGTSVVSNRRKISSFYFGVPAYTGGTHTHSYSYNFEAIHPHRIYAKCSCGDWYYTGETQAYNNCSDCMKLSWGYVQPFYAYTINTGKTIVYDAVNGNQKTNKIYDTDLCTIEEVYACDWCKVTFPLDTGGTDTGYCKVSVFMKSGGFIMYTSNQIDTYCRADMSKKIGYTGTGDKIYILGHTSSAIQIAYPLTAGGYKVGWIPNSALKYTIVYNSNGGSGSMSSNTTTYQKSFNISNNSFSKSGYSFAGWNVCRKSDNKWYTSKNGWRTEKEIKENGYIKSTYSNGISANLDKSWVNLGKTNDTLTFYAVWNPNTLNVYYNANGGSIKSDTYKLSSNVVYNKTSGEKYCQKWTYNTTKEYGLTNAVATFGLYKTGYTFAGWGTTTTGGNIFNDNDSTIKPTDINSNIKSENCSSTLYAQWKINTYTVTYNTNGGTGSIPNQTKTHGVNLTLSTTKPTGKTFTVSYNANGGNVSLASKTVSQSFVNWNTEANGSGKAYSAGATYSDNSSVTLYAQYSNPSIGSLPTPTRSGYTFDGWYTSASDRTKITDSTKVTTNATLYAHWTKIADVKATVKAVGIEHNVTINYKSNYVLTPEIVADPEAEYTVEYKSSDDSVVKVDQNGKLYGAKKGNATITCTVTDSFGNVVTDECNVNIDYSTGQWMIIIFLFGWIWYI